MGWVNAAENNDLLKNLSSMRGLTVATQASFIAQEDMVNDSFLEEQGARASGGGAS
jgi:hypothetical protein